MQRRQCLKDRRVGNAARANLDHETLAAAVHSLLPELLYFFPSVRALAALHVLEACRTCLCRDHGRKDGTEEGSARSERSL